MKANDRKKTFSRPATSSRVMGENPPPWGGGTYRCFYKVLISTFSSIWMGYILLVP